MERAGRMILKIGVCGAKKPTRQTTILLEWESGEFVDVSRLICSRNSILDKLSTTTRSEYRRIFSLGMLISCK